MPASDRLSVKIDGEARTAYITLTDARVASTVEFDEDIYLDLDEFGMVRGIELLNLERAIPLDDLAERYHINTATLIAIVQSIRFTAAPRTALTGSGGARQQPRYQTVVTRPENPVVMQ
jgi:uncharacterized protein YuzE